MTKTCAVIGSGIGGLAAAIRLASHSYKVDVYEANDYPGGKMRQFHKNGFRFDMGPSVITLPYLLDELFELHDKNPRDYFNYTRLEKPFNYFFPDGTVLHSYDDLAQYGKEIESKTKDSASIFEKYLKDVATKYKITKPVFIENSIHRIKDFLNMDVLYGILNFYKIDAFKSMDKGNKSFFSDPNLVALFNYYATYVGSNPFVAPATLNVIQHLEITEGLFMPDKGIYSIVEALFKLANEVGINFYFNNYVDEIITNNKTATGIIVNGEAKPYNVVVSNMDVFFTYNKLLQKAKQPKRILHQEKSSSVIGFYWGINRQFPKMDVHNMFFSKNQKEEYSTVFNEKTIYHDPTLYICITSKHVADDAPTGKENWFVLVNAPHDQGQDWDKLRDEARENAIKKITSILETDFKQYIEFEESIYPPSIEQDYRSAFGALYGNSSNGKFAAFLRHANFSRKIKHLYFVGGSTHPGAGIPMCLNSAKIMEKIIFD